MVLGKAKLFMRFPFDEVIHAKRKTNFGNVIVPLSSAEVIYSIYNVLRLVLGVNRDRFRLRPR